MPTVTVEGYGSFEVAAGTRLINALIEHKVDILHRCGGLARCTTCRVSFQQGEPEAMTYAEHKKLSQQSLLGKLRLACQILVEADMHLDAQLSLLGSGLDDAGPQPAPELTPSPRWLERHEITPNP